MLPFEASQVLVGNAPSLQLLGSSSLGTGPFIVFTARSVRVHGRLS